MKRILIVALGTLTAVLSALAVIQAFPLAGQQRSAGPFEEVRAYIREYVLPVVLEERHKLVLNREEEDRLSAVRSTLDEMREERRSNWKKRRDDFDGDRPSVLGVEEREEMRQRMWEHRKLMLRVSDIVVAHEDAVFNLLGNIRDHEEQWRADIHEILQRYREENAGPVPGSETPPEWRRKPGVDMQGPMHVPGRRGSLAGMHVLGRLREPEFFVLLDPASENFPWLEEMTETARMFPNPAGAMVHIELEHASSGMARVTIYDRQGAEVKSADIPLVGEGKQTVELDVSDLTPGLYFYEVVLGNQVLAKDRFVKY